MLIIGEKINASNKSVAEAIGKRDEEFIKNLAKSQADAGADFIDVNAGIRHSSRQDEGAIMEWLVEVIQSATDKPLVIDSDAPNVIQAALRKYRGEKIIINSVTIEHERLSSIGSLAAERKTWVVALAMGADRIPGNAEQRLTACDVIMSHLVRLGVEADKVFFDPLVLPIAVDSNQALVALNTLELIKSRYPVSKTIMGLSNISYGLPKRNLINRAFLMMAAYAGLDAVILDPLDAKVMSFALVADMLMGKDHSCRGYLRATRKGTIVD